MQKGLVSPRCRIPSNEHTGQKQRERQNTIQRHTKTTRHYTTHDISRHNNVYKRQHENTVKHNTTSCEGNNTASKMEEDDVGRVGRCVRAPRARDQQHNRPEINTNLRQGNHTQHHAMGPTGVADTSNPGIPIPGMQDASELPGNLWRNLWLDLCAAARHICAAFTRHDFLANFAHEHWKNRRGCMSDGEGTEGKLSPAIRHATDVPQRAGFVVEDGLPATKFIKPPKLDQAEALLP